MKDSIKTETSASASGDEIETTTSSDIEIIASPQAGIRQLVAPVRSRSESKTHSRKPSEASSDDSATSTGQDSDPLKTECQIIQLNQILEVFHILYIYIFFSLFYNDALVLSLIHI